MKDILSEIIKHKRIEVEMQKQAISSEHLRAQVDVLMNENSPRRSMHQALAAAPTGILAESNRRSPSHGWIYEAADAEQIPAAYEAAGASAISILTDEKYFGGSLRDIRIARPLVNSPILRKDFIIDEYQLFQARIVEADAILLIAACLSREECSRLTARAHALGLEVLLEIHSPSELSYISQEIDMIGINNRNLGTFVTDVENSFRLAGQLSQAVVHSHEPSAKIPENLPLLVSESGITHPETIRKLRMTGFRGFLMGETFMRTEHPENTLKEFISQTYPTQGY